MTCVDTWNAEMLFGRVAADRLGFGSAAFARAVARLWVLLAAFIAVELNQHREIDFAASFSDYAAFPFDLPKRDRTFEAARLCASVWRRAWRSLAKMQHNATKLQQNATPLQDFAARPGAG